MRVAIIAGPYVPVPPHKYGGTELVIHFIVKGLVEAGHTPILLAPGDSTTECELIPIIEKSVFYPKKKADLPAFYKTLARAEEKTRQKLDEILPTVDIIHSHGFDLLPYKDFPNLTTLHGPIMPEHIAYLQERCELNYALISEDQRSTMPHENTVSVVYNGEDPDAFPIVTEPDDYVCFLGRFDTEKTPHLAIQLAIKHGVKIKVAGKIDYLAEDYFDEYIQPYLEHPLVEYLGELGFDEKVALLSRAKCNLHPTGFREPFGLTVLEAAYCGTPTLAISRGSMPELIEDGKTGLLVENFSEGTDELERCFAMDRAYIARRSREQFNYRKMAEQYVETYKKVIAQYPKE